MITSQRPLYAKLHQPLQPSIQQPLNEIVGPPLFTQTITTGHYKNTSTDRRTSPIAAAQLSLTIWMVTCLMAARSARRAVTTSINRSFRNRLHSSMISYGYGFSKAIKGGLEQAIKGSNAKDQKLFHFQKKKKKNKKTFSSFLKVRIRRQAFLGLGDSFRKPFFVPLTMEEGQGVVPAILKETSLSSLLPHKRC